MVRADVHGVVGPVGNPDDGEPGGVADDELDVVGVGSAAPMIDDDDGLAEFLDPDLQVPVGGGAGAGTFDGDIDRFGDLGVTADGHQCRGVERRECLCRNPISGHPTLTEPLVAAAHLLGGYAVVRGDGDLGATGGVGRAVVQAAQPLERGEPPQFVAAVRHLERVNVEGGEQLPLFNVAVIRPSPPSATRSAG